MSSAPRTPFVRTACLKYISAARSQISAGWTAPYCLEPMEMPGAVTWVWARATPRPAVSESAAISMRLLELLEGLSRQVRLRPLRRQLHELLQVGLRLRRLSHLEVGEPAPEVAVGIGRVEGDRLAEVDDRLLGPVGVDEGHADVEEDVRRLDRAVVERFQELEPAVEHASFQRRLGRDDPDGRVAGVRVQDLLEMLERFGELLHLDEREAHLLVDGRGQVGPEGEELLVLGLR